MLGSGGRAKAVELFGAEPRSLAVFRIVLAFLALADLAGRATDLSAHYTDKGILPRAALLEGVLSRWAFSPSIMRSLSSRRCCSASRGWRRSRC